jgi:ABC-type uncharacterized transport system involved in gliding motility auxiliary subunit
MRLWAEEKRLGTIELLFTMPVTETEAVLGKYLSALFFLFLLLLFTIPIPITIALLGDPDPGPIICGYIGAFLLGGAFLAIGIFCSSLTSAQIISFIITVVFCFILLIAGEEFVLIGLPDILVRLFRFISLSAHFESIARGLIDSRDVFYYLSLICIFLYFNIMVCEGVRKKRRMSPVFLSLIVVGIAVVINLICSLWYIRYDLTDTKQYTLSRSTEQILQKLDDVINIRCYFSKELPPRLSSLKRDVKDILDEYRIASSDKLSYSFVDPEENEQKVRLLGIPKVQFSVIKRDEISAVNLYLGMAILYEDRSEVIPVIQDTTDLEYEISSRILKLCTEEAKRVGFLADQKEYTRFVSHLKNDYEIVESMDADTLIATEIEDVEKMRKFVEEGGGLLVLADQMEIEGLLARPKDSNINLLLKKWGITIEENLILDRFCANASFNSGFVIFTLPYPFFLKIIEKGLNREHPIVRDLESLVLPFASSIAAGTESVLLISSSPSSWTEKGRIDLNPQRGFYPTKRKSHPLAVALTPREGRVVVVGCSRIAKDQFIGYAKDNLTFLLNCVEWLSFGGDLIEIRSKQKTERPLKKLTERQKKAVRIAVIFGMPAVISLFGLVRGYLRRKRW